MEIWKPIKNWEDKYEVSNYGNVRNKMNGKFVIGDVNNFGYYRVKLYSKGRSERFFRHRLVATHFIPNPNGCKFVNHIDGDKSNNSVFNLEWVTQSENEKHAFQLGLKRKTNKCFVVEFDNGIVKQYENQYLFAEELNISQSMVSTWLSGKRPISKKHKIKNIYFVE